MARYTENSINEGKNQSYTLEVINPETAITYLGKLSPRQRAMSKGKAWRWSGLLSNGGYTLTHQGIAFSDRDLLIDGQHRLMGIVLSGATVPMWVARGLNEEAYKNIDQPHQRNLGTYIGGKDIQALVNGLTRIIVRKSPKLTVRQAEIIKKAYRKQIEWANNIPYKPNGLTRSSVLSAVAYCSMADFEKISAFYERVLDGSNLATTSPELRLREMLMLSTGSGRQLREGLEIARAVAVAVRLFLEGKSCHRIQTNGAQGQNALASFDAHQPKEIKNDFRSIVVTTDEQDIDSLDIDLSRLNPKIADLFRTRPDEDSAE